MMSHAAAALAALQDSRLRVWMQVARQGAMVIAADPHLNGGW